MEAKQPDKGGEKINISDKEMSNFFATHPHLQRIYAHLEISTDIAVEIGQHCPEIHTLHFAKCKIEALKEILTNCKSLRVLHLPYETRNTLESVIRRRSGKEKADSTSSGEIDLIKDQEELQELKALLESWNAITYPLPKDAYHLPLLQKAFL